MSKRERVFIIAMCFGLYVVDALIFPEPNAVGTAAKYAHADLPLIFFFLYIFVRGVWILFFEKSNKQK